MVVHELYELFLVHSHDNEPLLHDILILISTGSWQCPMSHSWVHRIFMNLFMRFKFHIHGFIRFKKKHGITLKIIFSRSSDSWVHIIFISNIDTSYAHIHGDDTWVLFPKQSS